ncbi:type II toxin-antitoxin system VapC family toxin [Microbacterium sp. NPDC087665]|uniref:type II toxin-antitoxin system VapC family toxin n=1 Tax=Microbacterium sp. NPDC087665 TaxID=3364194 RepID=UPI00380D8731
MIVLDASVAIAFLNKLDAHHESAVEVLKRNPPTYLMHPLTLAEVLVGPVLLGIDTAVLRDLRAIGVEQVSAGANEALDLARLRASHRLKMPDTCVLATAQHHDVALATFDDRLAGAASEFGLLADGL